jgi:D-glycero-alpha-D-manno-heptose-7-phosphate kinase
MGSSSAFTVGLLHALHGLRGYMISQRQLATESIHIEQNILQENVGSQDQVSAAYGGLNHIIFLPNGEFSVRRMTISPERVQQLDDHLMLFYTGIKRTASDVAQSFLEDLDKRRRQLRIMKDLVEESISILNSQQDICAFGELLHEAWDTKRTLSDMVSNTEVDTMYAKARDAGAVGGKLLGAGGGGFLMLFVPPAKQEDVREVLDDLIHVPFTFEFSGSQIIFFDPEQDFSAAEEDRMQRSPQSFRELIPGTSFS